MVRLYIANWKSHKSFDDANHFFDVIKEKLNDVDLSQKEIIIAPPSTLLYKCKSIIDQNNLPVKLASQNVSPFPEGAYTGEISAKQVKEFADYVIIGHSERRKYFHESESDIENKIRESKEVGLKIIQCVQDEKSQIHDVETIAYEPPSAIGSGNPDDPEHISYVFGQIKKDNPNVNVLYGGSVNSENIKNFLGIENLSGFLIGGASLDAESFLTLLNG